MQITNPILTGFHADPCICRRDDDYYIAVSSFEWFPGIPVYHSRDMKHWELYTHVLTDERQCDLKKLPSAKGIWAPDLTWCEEDGLFYVVYGVMNSMNARYFDVDNYLITAEDIHGPWSEPVYLHSAGFDAAMLHDTDGRKYIVSLDWETRSGYEKPGEICIAEYDPDAKAIKGYPQRIWRGGTDRGCLEAPRLTRRGDHYYLMCAEGGTGYYHCVTMARAKSPYGPYEGDPENPILTSYPEEHNERADTDHLKRRYYNPDTYLQKCGHASYVETPCGETYMVHLCARPFTPELRCTLGRETAMQKMKWTDDGWLRLASGGIIAETDFEGSALPDWEPAVIPETDDFEFGTAYKAGENLSMWRDSERDAGRASVGIQYYSPRIPADSFCDLESRPGWLRMRGQEAPSSLNRVSILARKLRSVNAEIITKMDFTPEIHQHSAGLILYYDNMNYAYIRKYYSDTLGSPAISVLRMNNGVKTDYNSARRALTDDPVWLRLRIKGRESQFSWSFDGMGWMEAGPAFDTSEFSDEYSEYGEFTGAFVGLTCADRIMHSKCADFDFFTYRDFEQELLTGAHTSSREQVYADKLQKEMRRSVQSLSTELHEAEMSHNSYAQEVREQECIRKGDLQGLYRAFDELEMDKVGVLSENPLRNMKNLAIVVISLASRSAIQGGLSPETAFSMEDAFVRDLEKYNDCDKVFELCRKAEVEYCLAIREKSRSSTDNPAVIRCRDIISRLINTRITVSDLAARLNMSPDYLSQLFSKEEGITLTDYIAREKIRAAERELIFTDKAIDDIAASLSFSSQSHFGKVFKKWTGMTPNQYRRTYGAKE